MSLLFSVIIPNLHSPVVDRTIASLEQQNFDPSKYEIVVVGMDKHGLVQESERVRFIRTPQPLSPARARNLGATQTEGEILAFIDADCVAHPDWLQVIASRFEDPEVQVLGGGVEIEARNYWTLADNLALFYEYLAIHSPGTRQILPSLNFILRRQVFSKLEGFNVKYPFPAGEDADLTLRLRQAGYTLHFEPRALVHHQPPRTRLVDLLRHSFLIGRYSTKVDPRYSKEKGSLGWVGHPAMLILLSPLLASGVTTRVFQQKSVLRRYWYTIPAVFLAKLAWCAGAASYQRALWDHSP